MSLGNRRIFLTILVLFCVVTTGQQLSLIHI